MLISKKQYSHYLLPALPYIALGLSGLPGSHLLALLNAFNRWYAYRRNLVLAGGLLCLGSLILMGRQAGTMFYYDRVLDRVLLQDLHTLSNWVPQQTRLGVYPNLMKEFPLRPYLQRYYRIDMAPWRTIYPTFC